MTRVAVRSLLTKAEREQVLCERVSRGADTYGEEHESLMTHLEGITCRNETETTGTESGSTRGVVGANGNELFLKDATLQLVSSLIQRERRVHVKVDRWHLRVNQYQTTIMDLGTLFVGCNKQMDRSVDVANSGRSTFVVVSEGNVSLSEHGQPCTGRRGTGISMLKEATATEVARSRENVMEITKVQSLLATKAHHQKQHRFNELYRYMRDERWLEAAKRSILQNRGARTPGVDGVVGTELSAQEWQEMIEDTMEALRNGNYQPMPAKRVYIPKSNGKMRPLGIPTIRDRMVQEALRMVLEPIYESHFLPCSHGFRPCRSTMTAMTRVQYMSGIHSYYWIVEGDIKGCFDNIPHRKLIHTLREVIADEKLLDLIWSFLKSGYEENDKMHRPHRGTPQGGIVSPLLANIYLHKLDTAWQERYDSFSASQRHTRRTKGLANVDLVRYADDFLILSNGTKDQAKALKPEFTEILAEMGLKLTPEKTLITHVNDGFEFLGFHIQRRPKPSDRQTYALYVVPTKRNEQRYKERIRSILSTTHGDTVNKIRAVNRVVMGWANYYRHVQSSRAFRRLDHWTFRAMWFWIYQKHGGGIGQRELYRRYIQRDANGVKALGYGTALLALMKNIPLRRFYLPRGGIQSPYLQPDQNCKSNEKDEPLSPDIWDGTSTQKGFALIRQDLLTHYGPYCQECGKKFPQHQLQAHHIRAQKHGGEDKRSNLRLLCADCHRKTKNYGSR